MDAEAETAEALGGDERLDARHDEVPGAHFLEVGLLRLGEVDRARLALGERDLNAVDVVRTGAKQQRRTIAHRLQLHAVDGDERIARVHGQPRRHVLRVVPRADRRVDRRGHARIARAHRPRHGQLLARGRGRVARELAHRFGVAHLRRHVARRARRQRRLLDRAEQRPDVARHRGREEQCRGDHLILISSTSNTSIPRGRPSCPL